LAGDFEVKVGNDIVADGMAGVYGENMVF